MAVDEQGREIVDGKPHDFDEVEMDAVLAGLNRDRQALRAARLGRTKSRVILRRSNKLLGPIRVGAHAKH